jgi:hypothetical protein
MGTPSARQQEVHDTVERLGSATLAAAALGISRVTVDVTLAHYHQKVCTERAAEMETRIAELEAEVRRLRATPARVVVIDHRRVADGGKRKRQQLREARR